MARHAFGGGIADFVVTAGSGGALLLAAAATVTFWNAETAGTQHTDLLDLTEVAVTSVTSDSSGAIPRFFGPLDGDVRTMWAAASADGSGPRRLITATDIPADVASLLERVTQLEATVTAQQALLNNAMYSVRYDAGAGAYPPRPAELAGQEYVVWIGPPTPTGAQTKDLHIDTVE
jgi:hypothetical protein